MIDTMTDVTFTGVMNTLDGNGDTKLLWDKDVPEEVEAARKHFNRLTKPKSKGGLGYLAYTVEDGGGKGEHLREFDPEATRIILAPQTAGG